MLLFVSVTEEAGRKYVRDMPWPPAAECNMITNKQKQEKKQSFTIKNVKPKPRAKVKNPILADISVLDVIQYENRDKTKKTVRTYTSLGI